MQHTKYFFQFSRRTPIGILRTKGDVPARLGSSHCLAKGDVPARLITASLNNFFGVKIQKSFIFKQTFRFLR